MFELNEAVRGRLIDPEPWDRIVIIFGAILQFTDCVRGLCGLFGYDLCIKPCYDVCEVGIDREIRVHRVNRKLCSDRNSTRGFYCS